MLLGCSSFRTQRRNQGGGHAPQIFSIFNHVLLWEIASQTTILLLACSHTFWPPNFWPPNKFWSGYPAVRSPCRNKSKSIILVMADVVALVRCNAPKFPEQNYEFSLMVFQILLCTHPVDQAKTNMWSWSNLRRQGPNNQNRLALAGPDWVWPSFLVWSMTSMMPLTYRSHFSRYKRYRSYCVPFRKSQT